MTGSEWCWNHSPDHAAARAEGRKRGGYRRKRVPPNGAPGAVRLRSTEDVLELLERAVLDAGALDLSPERCRVLIQAAGSALKALEVGSIEERLAALEAAAGQRRAS